eukprot:364631-Chlamydomonas_euryale.AAC.9
MCPSTTDKPAKCSRRRTGCALFTGARCTCHNGCGIGERLYTTTPHQKPARPGRLCSPPLPPPRRRACWSHELRLRAANAAAAVYVATVSAADAPGLAASAGSALWDPRKSHASALADPTA